MLSIDFSTLGNPDIYRWLTCSVGPRPIALVSSRSADGVLNLAPFSYFNLFSTQPPILAIGPNRSGKTGVQKDTGINLRTQPDAVVNVVTEEMVAQTAICSGAFPPEVNEFERSGFTPEPSVRVGVPRVKESPLQFECRVVQVLPLGDGPGAGDLVLLQVLLLHVDPAVLAPDGLPDPERLNPVARMGRNQYARVRGSIFTQDGPGPNCLGWPGLPAAVRNSAQLSANQKARLAMAEALPNPAEVEAHAQATAKAAPAEVRAGLEDALVGRNLHEAWLWVLAHPEAL